MEEIIDVDEVDDLATLDESLGQVPRAYDAFQQTEDVPVYRALYVEDINGLDTRRWDRTGQSGAFINLYGHQYVNDLQLHELEPGGETTFQQHLYESVVFVTEGKGFAVIGEDADVTFEWEENSLFFLPPNTPYKFINASDSPSRLVAQTPLPQLMAIVRDPDTIFGIDSTWEGDDEYYSAEGSVKEVVGKDGAFVWDSAFIPDIMKFDDLRHQQTMGAQLNIDIMPDSCMGGHLAEIPAQAYKVTHKHGPGATVFMLSEEGYELMWRESWDYILRFDWKPGTIFAPPAHWYHNHFNLGTEAARHFAVHCTELGTMTLRGGVFFFANPDNVISYVDENPILRETFEQELAERGLESRMPDECYADPDFMLSL